MPLASIFLSCSTSCMHHAESQRAPCAAAHPVHKPDVECRISKKTMLQARMRCRWGYAVLAVLLGILAQPAYAGPGKPQKGTCSSDLDCKGNEACVDGLCVSCGDIGRAQAPANRNCSLIIGPLSRTSAYVRARLLAGVLHGMPMQACRKSPTSSPAAWAQAPPAAGSTGARVAARLHAT